jgi:hypothetical protein
VGLEWGPLSLMIIEVLFQRNSGSGIENRNERLWGNRCADHATLYSLKLAWEAHRFHYCPSHPDWHWAQPTFCPWTLPLEVKVAVHEGEHSLPSSGVVKNGLNYTFACPPPPQYVFTLW